MAASWASSPRPLSPCLSVLTLTRPISLGPVIGFPPFVSVRLSSGRGRHHHRPFMVTSRPPSPDRARRPRRPAAGSGGPSGVGWLMIACMCMPRPAAWKLFKALRRPGEVDFFCGRQRLRAVAPEAAELRFDAGPRGRPCGRPPAGRRWPPRRGAGGRPGRRGSRPAARPGGRSGSSRSRNVHRGWIQRSGSRGGAPRRISTWSRPSRTRWVGQVVGDPLAQDAGELAAGRRSDAAAGGRGGVEVDLIEPAAADLVGPLEDGPGVVGGGLVDGVVVGEDGDDAADAARGGAVALADLEPEGADVPATGRSRWPGGRAGPGRTRPARRRAAPG